MGWWNTDTNGRSLYPHETGMVWGDGPADIMDEALDKIVKEFVNEWARKPTKAELLAGLKFTFGHYEEPTKADLRESERMLTAYNNGDITGRELNRWTKSLLTG